MGSPYGEPCPAIDTGQPCITRMPYRHDHPTWPHVFPHDAVMTSRWESYTDAEIAEANDDEAQARHGDAWRDR